MIKIKRSPTADTRTCDVTKVTSEQLLKSTKNHINDVQKGMSKIMWDIFYRSNDHDYTKITEHDMFYKDFKNNFKTQDWYKLHKREERHHLQSPDGVREDVDLIDVVECVVDCVMAGLARSGELRPIQIPADVLLKAVENTANKLVKNIKVEE